jgi:hypothetical protein
MLIDVSMCVRVVGAEAGCNGFIVNVSNLFIYIPFKHKYQQGTTLVLVHVYQW